MKCRVFFVILVIMAAYSCSKAKIPDSTVPVYIGTYTDEGSKGIYYSRFDTVSGELNQPVAVASLINPSYLTLSPCKSLLFAVSESDGLTPNVYSYKINPETGQLTLADSLTTGGVSSCFVSVVDSGMIAFANYSSGTVSFVSYNREGRFDANTVTFQHVGSGPDVDRQKGPDAHSIQADREMTFIYAADLGIDKLIVYNCIKDSVLQVSEIDIIPGSGPRHIDFHPSGEMMALVNEMKNRVDLFIQDEKGVFSIKTQSVSLLSDSLQQGSWSADIHFSEDGKSLYASVRGVDCIDMFSVNVKEHSIERIGSVSEGINWPRNFALDPTGRFLLVANQKGNDIVVFRRDVNTGMLTPTGTKVELSKPVCIKF